MYSLSDNINRYKGHTLFWLTSSSRTGDTASKHVNTHDVREDVKLSYKNLETKYDFHNQ